MGLLFPLPFSRQIVSPLWPRGSTVEGWKQHTVSARGQARSCSQQKQVELGAIGKPFCWCRWVGGSVPALLCPWAAPQLGPEPGHLLDMHPQLRRQLQPLPGWIWLLFSYPTEKCDRAGTSCLSHTNIFPFDSVTLKDIWRLQIVWSSLSWEREERSTSLKQLL